MDRDKLALLRQAHEILGDRVISVQFSDGKEYHIPLSVVAMERGIYYAEGDEARGDATFEEQYPRELRHALHDPEDVLDYVANNTNWEDVSAYAKLANNNPPLVDYDDEWTNAHREILRFDDERQKWVRA